MDHAAKLARINSCRWYHSIEIEPGLVTPGMLSLDVLRRNLEYVGMPRRLDGLSVLDIGAWDGFYSFEAERRGAARVVAYDLTPPDHFAFAIARELIGSKVEYVRGSVYDLSNEVAGGPFDVVFFFGVLYHLRYPLLALDRIWPVCRQFLLLETNCMDDRLILADGKAVRLQQIDRRLANVALYRFYRKDELMPGDFSNWFSPNKKAIEESLWSAGFKPELLSSWASRCAFKATKLPGPPEYLAQTYEGYIQRGAF
jgi:tRNA (mo5U34)-methyltransferase